MVVLRLFLVLFLASAKLKPSKVLYAIDCGGNGFKTKDGIVFRSDDFYKGGKTSDFGRSVSSFRFTDLIEVYQTERWDEQSFSYNLPISKDDTYVLVLKFSEVFFDQEGKKVFNIKLGDRLIVRALDIYSVIGKNSAYDEFIQFELKQQKIYVDHREAHGAYQNGRLIVEFVSLGYDNPKVNGIMIVRGTLNDTNYAEQQETLQTLAKQEALIAEGGNISVDDEHDYEDQLREQRMRDRERGSTEAIGWCVLVALALLLWVYRANLKIKNHRR